jgi:hypothetical protein
MAASLLMGLPPVKQVRADDAGARAAAEKFARAASKDADDQAFAMENVGLLLAPGSASRLKAQLDAAQAVVGALPRPLVLCILVLGAVAFLFVTPVVAISAYNAARHIPSLLKLVLLGLMAAGAALVVGALTVFAL